jgi:hypothetical protein
MQLSVSDKEWHLCGVRFFPVKLFDLTTINVVLDKQ